MIFLVAAVSPPEVNNAIGRRVLSSNDFDRAIDTLQFEAPFDDAVFRAEDHSGPGGWYSSEALAEALRETRQFALRLPALHDGTVDVLADSLVAGAVVNRQNTHWLALRYVNGTYWVLDSMRSPTRLSRAELTTFLVDHSHVYAIEVLPHPVQVGALLGLLPHALSVSCSALQALRDCSS